MYEKYIEGVLTDKIVAGKTIKQACQRHIDDLANQKTDSFPYHFRPEKAAEAINTMKLMCYPAGKHTAGFRFEPLPFQEFMFAMLFGWYGERSRRFNEAHWSVSKKNYKSSTGAFIQSYMTFFMGELAAQSYTVATTRNQAKFVYRFAQAIARFLRRDSAQFRRECTVQEKFIRVKDLATLGATESFISTLASQVDSIDGIGSTCGIVDEYHVHKTDGVYENVKSSSKLLPDSLLLSITTAGFNLFGPCHLHEEYCQDVLDGILEDHSLFPFLFKFDDEENEWKDPEMWAKTNPVLPHWQPDPGIGIDPEKLMKSFITATNKAGPSLRAFKTKELNIWCKQTSDYVKIEDVRASWDDSLRLEDFRGRTAIICIDLASTRDISAMTVQILPNEDDPITYRFREYWVPQDCADVRAEQHRVNYFQWIETGDIKTTPGNATDNDYILRRIHEVAEIVKVIVVGSDAWGITDVFVKLHQSGFNVCKIRAIPSVLNAGTRRNLSIHEDRLLKTPPDKVYAFMMSNTEIKEVSDCIAPDKNESKDVIDGVFTDVLCDTLFLDPSKYKLPEPEPTGFIIVK